MENLFSVDWASMSSFWCFVVCVISMAIAAMFWGDRGSTTSGLGVFIMVVFFGLIGLGSALAGIVLFGMHLGLSLYDGEGSFYMQLVSLDWASTTSLVSFLIMLALIQILSKHKITDKGLAVRVMRWAVKLLFPLFVLTGATHLYLVF